MGSDGVSWSAVVLLVISSGACGDPQIVVPEVLTVDFYPDNGSVWIGTDVECLVAFSHEVADTAVAVQAISFACEGTPPCQSPVATGCPATTTATVAFDPGGFTARVTPDAGLQTGTCYSYAVSSGVEAKADNVGPLPSERTAIFETRP